MGGRGFAGEPSGTQFTPRGLTSRDFPLYWEAGCGCWISPYCAMLVSNGPRCGQFKSASTPSGSHLSPLLTGCAIDYGWGAGPWRRMPRICVKTLRLSRCC